MTARDRDRDRDGGKGAVGAAEGLKREGVAATESGEVLDNITVQALIARYLRVAGMTGTARGRCCTSASPRALPAVNTTDSPCVEKEAAAVRCTAGTPY